MDPIALQPAACAARPPAACAARPPAAAAALPAPPRHRPATAAAADPCAACPLYRLCTRHGEDAATGVPAGALQRVQWKVARGQALFRMGDPFRSLHVVQRGSFKTVFSAAAGEEVVTGFHLAGDAIGVDGISAQAHACSAFALEDSRVCSISYARLGALCQAHAEFAPTIGRLIGRYWSCHRRTMLTMRARSADQRLAGFLLHLSDRARAAGASALEFPLTMRRRDISRNIGLSLETVSREIAKFRALGLADVRRNSVRIADLGGLRAMDSGVACPA